MLKNKILYTDLNAKQKEIYNFQKVSALFADYGFTTIKLADDWQGADFIAMNFEGEDFLRVQLKGRLTFDKKYIDKNLYICFNEKRDNEWYLYPHDKVLQMILNKIKNSESWKIDGSYSYPGLSSELKSVLKPYLFK